MRNASGYILFLCCMVGIRGGITQEEQARIKDLSSKIAESWQASVRATLSEFPVTILTASDDTMSNGSWDIPSASMVDGTLSRGNIGQFSRIFARSLQSTVELALTTGLDGLRPAEQDRMVNLLAQYDKVISDLAGQPLKLEEYYRRVSHIFEEASGSEAIAESHRKLGEALKDLAKTATFQGEIPPVARNVPTSWSNITYTQEQVDNVRAHLGADWDLLQRDLGMILSQPIYCMSPEDGITNRLFLQPEQVIALVNQIAQKSVDHYITNGTKGLTVIASTSSSSSAAPSEAREFISNDPTTTYKYEAEYQRASAAADVSGAVTAVIADDAAIVKLIKERMNLGLLEDSKFTAAMGTQVRTALTTELSPGGKIDKADSSKFTRLNFKWTMRDILLKVIQDNNL